MNFSSSELDSRARVCACASVYMCAPSGAASMMVITSSGQSNLFIFLGKGREGYFIWLGEGCELKNPTVPCSSRG